MGVLGISVSYVQQILEPEVFGKADKVVWDFVNGSDKTVCVCSLASPQGLPRVHVCVQFEALQFLLTTDFFHRSVSK